MQVDLAAAITVAAVRDRHRVQLGGVRQPTAHQATQRPLLLPGETA